MNITEMIKQFIEKDKETYIAFHAVALASILMFIVGIAYMWETL